MKKITLVLFFLASFLGFAQSPLDKISTYVNENRSKLTLTTQDVSDLVIVNEFSSESTGINNYHVKQRHNGIEVYNSDSNFWIKNGKVINGGEDFISNVAQKVNATAPSVDVKNGLLGVLSQLGGNSQLSSTDIITVTGNEYKLTNGILSEDPVRAELVYFLTPSKALRLAWDYEFYSQDTKHLWNLKVDAVTGAIIEKRDMVISCQFGSDHSNHNHNGMAFTKSLFKDASSPAMMTPGTTNYRVIPWNYESPNHSARQLITNPEYTANASPNGWHNASNSIGGATTTYTITRGNNVFAKDDVDSNNTGGASPTGTGSYPSLTFDFAYGGTSAVASTYLPAATTNLFYMNNIMHDVWYQYGFNEVNKNFQSANYGRGGTGNDPVNAEAQDGATLSPTPNLNNANFSTPGDGSSPRMQMYLWDVGPSPTITVTTPPSVAGVYSIKDNNFSPGHVALPIAPAGITGQFVLFDDGTPDTSDACTAAINGAALNGKIAVIRRGTCTFISKVKLAQTAGAIAVVVVNNVDGTIIMGGADATVTIPAVSMNMTEGEALIAALGAGLNGTISAPNSTFVNSDGDFDNGIIAHEYGHGISTRLSGNCLNSSEQQGEGWSDWFWLMMQIKPGDTRNDARGIGTFAMNQPTNGGGIRQYRYSTDMAVNPHTFGDTNDMWYTDADLGADVIDVHSVGSVWAVMLWDLAWNYIDKYGYNPNMYTGTGGNNKVMKLVLDAIKLDGCSPSFVTARDAIIAADQATTGGADYCMIWETFARRGLGVNASSGTNSGTPGIQDQVEDFTVPAPGPNCTLAVDQFQNENAIRVYPNPTKGQLNIAINNYSGKLSIQVFDLNGRKVYNQEVNDFNAESAINLNNLQTGMYLLKVNGENLNYTQKIILN